nr:DUF1697 domain-containing protein [uncultured Dyadobacter sp.]
MQTYIAILRGINVGGTSMIKMPVLQKAFEDAGFRNVKTYIQSGNVLFNHHRASEPGALADEIGSILKRDLKLDVPVLVLVWQDMNGILENNPFVNTRQEDITKLHVTFLADLPETDRVSKIERDKYLPDEFYLSGKAIYLFCPEGYGRTKLNNNFFESKLKMAATTRNWKTVTELVRLGGELAASREF